MKKPTTTEDLAHKMRAQLVQLYEAACEIDFPRGSDVAFRDALQARIRLGCADLVHARAGDQGQLISVAQDVRLYKANAGVRNPDDSTLTFRVELQRTLGKFFDLQAAMKGGS
ncbi:hypothetical protein [Geminisphaera colitermitum]|uniref:hypothetical protein n=1 Tax=Geminisphaera colitermitum TaxID=1148786 RepID=UPI000158D586|nr:hypothetical protein [Geminisphaera colitermitum]